MNQENNDSKICPICERPTHKESKYCIFHASVQEKTEKEFKKALKEYVKKIKKENKEYNFIGFSFIGDINFREDLNVTIFKNAFFFGATFEGNAYFRKITFEGDIDFSKVTFQGDTSFRGATFKGDADFSWTIFEGRIEFLKVTFQGDTSFIQATFEENAYFDIAIFQGEASFCNATFKDFADFKRAIFEEVSGFRGATFKLDADFKEVTFERNTYFERAIFQRYVFFLNVTFQGDADFTLATFEGDTYFKVKSFGKNINFAQVNLFPGKELNLKVENNKGGISFERAYLENTYLKIYLSTDVLIDFTDALLKNTKIKKSQIENHILQEKEKKFSEAQEIYLLLKNNFHSIGQYKDGSWAYTKERDMERMSQSFYPFLNKYKKYSSFKKILMKSNVLKRVIIKTKIFSKWLFSKKAFEWIHLAFSNFIYQYGESPRRVIRFALIIIFLFAFILNFSGIVNSDRTNMIIEFIKKSQGNEYTLRYLGATLGNFLDCLYFSVVTFTTLGYGDFQPLEGWSRFLVSSEALLGAFTMALFVYTFARRTGGR
ncbi:pentapeptide repeat-containing protein [bacterium]|nr:pentapeptide repeat-containing protein [bacterium]